MADRSTDDAATADATDGDRPAGGPTIADQLAEANGGPIEPLNADELGLIRTLAQFYACHAAAQGARPPADILRGLMGAAFQVTRPYATDEQLALGTVDQTKPH